MQISIPPLRDRGSDIVLLARKFAADFAERYRTPAITLDDSARRLLTAYRWPGNVRQLKNVIEQMSLFEAGGEVNASTMENYIPQNATLYTPAVASRADNAHSYAAEREILFNMIFRLQHEIEELRTSIDSHQADNPAPDTLDISRPATLQSAIQSIVKYRPTMTELIDRAPAVDTVTTEATPATLEDTERETIRRSLERNSGRRKATARELNISERTLYRKIKEFGLE